ncbi:MAG: alanine racemase [Candidatus Pacebacteria bacterium]|nr:alanine racemase [Candidatus Paceibacterota bacterium]
MSNIHQELHTRPTFVEIDMQKLRHNYDEIRNQLDGQKMLCIVKGNAYGHGIVEMARAFESYGADYLGVAIPEEGVELRRSGITIPILVLSAISDRQIPICIQYDLTITAPSDEKLDAIDAAAKVFGKQAKVHLKVDTGMGRIGVNWQRAEKFLPILQSSKNIDFEGLYAHFAMSDEESDFTQKQIERFDTVIEMFNNNGFDFQYIHHANSGGILFHSHARYSMVRAGMILYGLFEGIDLPAHINLQPVMNWKTEVVYFKFIEKGMGIGYGHHFVAEDDTRIITVPVGYADGFQRAMGTKGHVILRDILYPIAGRVCMDQMMVDIGRNGTAYKGDEVILVGESENQKITFFDIADWSGTSIYELLSQISYRVPRIYVRNEINR